MCSEATGEWNPTTKKVNKYENNIKKDGPPINIFDVMNDELTLEDSDVNYGMYNMYRDINAEDCNEVEKLLSAIEALSSLFIQAIVSGSDNLSLTRKKLMDFKKFLFIMMYRSEDRRGQYYEEKFDYDTRRSVEKHMKDKNIKNIRDVWFENIKWIIKSKVDEINKQVKRTHGQFSKDTGKQKWPIHVLELMDFGHLTMSYICIWEAQEGSEFILSENCFGCYEGAGPFFPYHHIFIVSPKYAVVLVNRLYMMEGAIDSLGFRKSSFEEFHADPECDYVKSREEITPDDVFKYKRIVLPKDKVWLVNCIFLDARKKSFTHKSDAAMYRSVLFYDGNKARLSELFGNQYDYMDLKKRLFEKMNRTHPN
ncbi:hypothetical protein BGZ76_009564 [Entomortierella beljakovae]|nr:hypothetical protein BGZ76_009564 [Entomortierella beljakovae]